MDEFNHITLDNGIRIIHKEITSTKVVHCGIVLDIGSRDELDSEMGLAHFWEHMVFKGTERRKAFHIVNRLESVGGEVNAYTTKEKIFFYSSVLYRHFDRALELLTDITFNSTFPERETEREKGVILEEMLMYRDTPEESIVDDFDNVVFEGHSLGNNILGTEESVQSFKRTHFRNFLKDTLDTNKIVISVVGNISLAKVKKSVQKYLSDIDSYSAIRKREPFKGFVPKTISYEKPINQAHCMMGTEAVNIYDDRKIPFLLLVNLLGGPGLSSRLNMSLREKHGLVYSVDASLSSYSDTGMFSIYFGTDKKKVNKAFNLVIKELEMLQRKPLGTLQLHRAKEQLLGQMALAEENKSTLMQIMGKSMLEKDRVDSFDEVVDKVSSIEAKDLMNIAHEYFDREKMSVLYYIPE